MITRRSAIQWLAAGAPAVLRGTARRAGDKPNLLFIWTDQQRADTMAAYGNRTFRVPNMNRLAQESVVFGRCYDTQPVCTPARSSVMTGAWPHTNGCVANNIPLPAQARTIAEWLADPAYRTGYMGKWHLGDEIFAQHGFEEWVSIEDGYRKHFSEGRDRNARSSYHHFLLALGYKPGKDGAFSRGTAVRLPIEHSKPAFLAQSASHFIRAHQSQPWMLYVNFLEPHPPFEGPLNDLHSAAEAPLPANYPGVPIEKEPEFYVARRRKGGKKDGDEGMGAREAMQRRNRNYAGLCAQVDQALGRILKALEDSGQTYNTVIVFTSDHGEMMGSHMLAGKQVLYEEAVRVPLLLRVPFRQARTLRVDRPVSHIDLVPTLLELLGSKPRHDSLPGKSLLRFLDGSGGAGDDVFIEWHTPPDGPHARAVITTDGWKMALFDRDNCLLFNRDKDPLEMRNLYYRRDSVPVVRRLRAKIQAWQRSTSDTLQLAAS